MRGEGENKGSKSRKFGLLPFFFEKSEKNVKKVKKVYCCVYRKAVKTKL